MEYDPEADALYITLGNPDAQVLTRPLDDDVNLDMDEHGHVVGIEILNARERVFAGGPFTVQVDQRLPAGQPA